MSTLYNPKTNTNGLVFMYDTGNSKSYIGEPTSNIVPDPEKNSRFTTSNNWRTYNTNQYNSNSYFSIGTVSSVSDNIVTLGTVGHNIRSFDVLRPETTGGGVTAGTDYVVKKLSSTTFSLHEYNSSQNGELGYINPDTNFFKVHDAYANDTRISISATDFPTSWWGYPHKPNSGLIKEIVQGGGRVPGTNAMRLHVYREDNVVDGMAYGVYCPVTAGDQITISVWLKRADGRGNGKKIGYSTYFGSGNSASSTTFGPLTTEWKRYIYSWTASTTFNFYSYWWPNSTSSAYAIDMCDFQVEINGHATPYVVGTRSATEGLIDRTGNSTIDLSNVSFDSNAEMTFDGTDDGINIDNSNYINDTETSVTVECIVRLNANQTSKIFAANYTQVSSPTGFALGIHDSSTNKVKWFTGNSGTTNTVTSTTTLSNDQYYHVVGTYNGSSKVLYINGVQEATATVSNAINNTSTVASIGYLRYLSNQRLVGDLPVVKVYNRALTSSEVTKNFNAVRSRFGL